MAIAPVLLLLRHLRMLPHPRHNLRLQHQRLHLHLLLHHLRPHPLSLHLHLHPRMHLSQRVVPKVWCCLPLCASSFRKTDLMCLALLVLALAVALLATM